MGKLTFRKEAKSYNDSNIKYQIKYYYNWVENVECSLENVVITTSDDASIDEDIINDIIKNNEVDMSFKSLPINVEDDYLTAENKRVINDEAKKILDFIMCGEYEEFDADKITESLGVNLKRGKWLELFKRIDMSLLKVIDEVFGAEHMEVPSIIDIEELQRSNYLDGSFHHVNFISHMERKYDNVNNFRKAKIVDLVEKEFLSKSKQVLNPAVCLHCYPLFKNRVIDTTKYITAIGQSFRDESGNLDNNVRLKEFTMREVVFIGSKEEANSEFKKMLQVMEEFGRALKLNFELMPSNDIFFDDNIGKKTAFQKALQNKIELEVYDDLLCRNVAIASTNRHGNHFSKPYEINTESGSAVTMCLAFGYDRIAQVLINKHAKR